MSGVKVPSRMSGSELSGCVKLVVAAFTDAADLMGVLSRKQKKRKGERDNKELQVYQLLTQSGRSVQKAFDDGVGHLGSVFKVGDDESRTRLLSIAIVLNADVVEPLQLASKSDGKIDFELDKIREFTVSARHDAVRTLGELRRHLNSQRSTPTSRFSMDSSDDEVHMRPVSILSAAPITPPEKSRMRRILSVSGSEHRRYSVRPESSPTNSRPHSIMSLNTGAFSFRRSSTVHSLSSVLPETPTKKPSARRRLEMLQHPDMPNYAAPVKAKPKPVRPATAAPPFYDDDWPLPAPLVVSPVLIHPAFRPQVAIPETPAELEPYPSARQENYDAASIYSRASDDDGAADPGTPITDMSSDSGSQKSPATPISPALMSWEDKKVGTWGRLRRKMLA